MPTRTPREQNGQDEEGMARGLSRIGKRAFISILGEDRFLQSREAHHLRLRRQHGKGLLLVHTMGKVGSTSVAASLKERGIRHKMAIYQPHFISDEGIAFAEALAVAGIGGWEKLQSKERSDLLRSRLLGQEVKRMRADGERVKVITMVRDPVATNISGLFHNHAWWPAALKAGCAEPSLACLEALRTYFLDTYPHDVPDKWFDLEARAVYGIDVYAEPFDYERGYQVYRSDSADMLVLKLEKLNEHGAEAVGAFMGLDDFRLIESNTAEDKSYARIYKAFRKEVSLPESYLDRIYGSRFSRHFYTPDEINVFRRKWLAPALKAA